MVDPLKLYQKQILQGQQVLSDPVKLARKTLLGQSSNPENRISQLHKKINYEIFKAVNESVSYIAKRPLSPAERRLLKSLIPNRDMTLTEEQKIVLERLGLGRAELSEAITGGELRARELCSQYHKEIEEIESKADSLSRKKSLKKLTTFDFDYISHARAVEVNTNTAIFSQKEKSATFEVAPYESHVLRYFKQEEVVSLPQKDSQTLAEAFGPDAREFDSLIEKLYAIARLAGNGFKTYHTNLDSKGRERIEQLGVISSRVEKKVRSKYSEPLPTSEDILTALSNAESGYHSLATTFATKAKSQGDFETLFSEARAAILESAIPESEQDELITLLHSSRESTLESAATEIILRMMDKVNASKSSVASAGKTQGTLDVQIAKIDEAISTYRENMKILVDESALNDIFGELTAIRTEMTQRLEYLTESKSVMEKINTFLPELNADGVGVDAAERYAKAMDSISTGLSAPVNQEWSKLCAKVKDLNSSEVQLARQRTDLEQFVAEISENYQELGDSYDIIPKTLISKLGEIETNLGTHAKKLRGEESSDAVKAAELILTHMETQMKENASKIFEKVISDTGISDTEVRNYLSERILANIYDAVILEDPIGNYAQLFTKELAMPVLAGIMQLQSVFESYKSTVSQKVIDTVSSYSEVVSNLIETEMSPDYRARIGGERMDEGVMAGEYYGAVASALKLADDFLLGETSLSMEKAQSHAFNPEFSTDEDMAGYRASLFEAARENLAKKLEVVQKTKGIYQKVVQELSDSQASPELLETYGRICEKNGEDILPINPYGALTMIREEMRTLCPINNAFGSEARGLFTLALWKNLSYQNISKIREGVSSVEDSDDFDTLMTSVEGVFARDGIELFGPERDAVALIIPRITAVTAESIPDYISTTERLFGVISRDMRKARKGYTATKKGLAGTIGYRETDESFERSLGVITKLGILEPMAPEEIKKLKRKMMPAFKGLKGTGLRIDELGLDNSYVASKTYAEFYKTYKAPFSSLKTTVSGMVGVARDTRNFQSTPQEYRNTLDSQISSYIYSIDSV